MAGGYSGVILSVGFVPRVDIDILLREVMIQSYSLTSCVNVIEGFMMQRFHRYPMLYE